MSRNIQSAWRSFAALGLFVSSSLAGDVNVPGIPPADTATVENGFVAFSLQNSDFAIYAGSPAQPNEITNNLLKALGDLTTPPPLRLGGNPQDFTTYDESQKEPVVNTQNPRHHTIGPSNLLQS